MTETTRYPVRLDIMGRHIEMKPTGEVRWSGAMLQQGWVPKRGGYTIWHDVHVVDPAEAESDVA